MSTVLIKGVAARAGAYAASTLVRRCLADGLSIEIHQGDLFKAVRVA